MLSVTFFAGDQSDTRPLLRHELEWHELRPLLEAATVHGPKRSGGYLIGSRTADGARRANATCGPATVLIVDYDDFEGEPDWSGWPGEILAHSSGSHLTVCDDNPTGAQRWRVYVRLAEPIPPEDYARVRDALTLPPGAHVRALSQPAFLPTYLDQPPEWVEVPGAPLAWRSLPLPPPAAPCLDPEHLTAEISYSDPEVRARLEQLLLVGKRPTKDGDQLLWAAACDLRTRYHASEQSTVAVLQAWHSAVLPKIDWPDHRVHRAAERAGWQVPAPAAPAPVVAPAPVEPAPALPPCPVDAFPPAVRDWIRAIEEAHRAAPDLIATCALGAMSAACQGRVTAEFEQGYATPTGLYLIAAAPAGSSKSPVFGAAFAPVAAWEERAREQTKPAYHLAVAARQRDEARLKALQAEQSTLLKRPEAELQPRGKSHVPEGDRLQQDIADVMARLDAPKPAPLRYLVEDITPAKAVELFALHGRLAVVSDEGSEVFDTVTGQRFGKEAKSDGLHVVLGAYDGKAVAVDRKDRDAARAAHAHLTICLGLQREPLDDALRNRELYTRGALDRFCWVRSNSVPRLASPQDRPTPVPAAVTEAYRTLLDRLCGLAPTALRASPEAYERWRAFVYECDQVDDQLIGWSRKHAFRAVRIAGVLAAADGAQEVSTGHVERAIQICQWYALHARLAFGIVPGAELAQQLADYVRSVGGVCTRRDVLRKFRLDVAGLQPALEAAEALELVRVEITGRVIRIIVQ